MRLLSLLIVVLMATPPLSAQSYGWRDTVYGSYIDQLVERGVLGSKGLQAAKLLDERREQFTIADQLPLEIVVTPAVEALYVLLVAFHSETDVRLRQLYACRQNPRFAELWDQATKDEPRDRNLCFSDSAHARLLELIEREGLLLAEAPYYRAGPPGDLDPYPKPTDNWSNFSLGGHEPVAYDHITSTFATSGHTRRKLIELIEELRLASASDVERARIDLQTGLIGTELELLEVLLLKRHLVDERDTARQQAARYVEVLLGLGLVDEGEALQQLREEASRIGIRKPYVLTEAILAASSKVRTIEIPPADEAPGKRYVAFLRKLSITFPQLQLTEPKDELRAAGDTLSEYDWLLRINYRLAGELYAFVARRHIIPDPRADYGDQLDPSRFDAWEILRDLEDNLEKQRIDVRLYLHPVREGGQSEISAWQMLPLTRAQAGALAFFDDRDRRDYSFGLRTAGLYRDPAYLEAEEETTRAAEAASAQLLPFPDAFDFGADQRSEATVDTLFGLWQDLGLLAGLSDDEIAASVERATHLLDAPSPGWLYRCVPRRVVFFDWEGADSNGAYAALLEQFALAGRGAFTLTDIEDSFPAFGEGGPYAGSFVLNGERYSFASRGAGDWLDTAFLETLQKALAEQMVGGQFYVVVDDGQASGLAYFTGEEVALLRERLSGMVVEG